MRRTTRVTGSLVASLVVVLAASPGLTSPATAQPGSATAVAPARLASFPRTPEVSTTTKLADRRSLFVGDRFWGMGAEDGSYPATGFHTRGEMGGFWTPPIKLLDGIWFKVGNSWLSSSKYTTGWGYQRMDLGVHNGVGITRTDFAPDGLRAGLIGLRLVSRTATTVPLAVDAHSELMKSYPWGETDPSQTAYNLPDTGHTYGNSLLFREQGRPAVPNSDTHDYAALVGSRLKPNGTELGPDHRGPQGDVVCPASGPSAPTQPDRCDDTAYGKGTGGQLSYTIHVPAGGTTVWFAIAGSDHGLASARQQQVAALRDPLGLLAKKIAAKRVVQQHSRVELPGDPLLERSVAWSKQNLAESVQESQNLKIRVTHAGKAYPAPSGTVAKARWFGAGFPDYPWLFATDGEYSSFAGVTSGQFDTVKAHLRALRDVSLVANGHSGKVVHEVTPDGQVYFGANGDAGNTDETAKFPSIVDLVWRWTGDKKFRDEMYPFAVSNLRYIFRVLDKDHDGWPEGLGNVETPGLGTEKLDNTVYTMRGLSDLADLAASKGDRTTQRWAAGKAAGMEKRFEKAWWNGSNTKQYADSLTDPDNAQVFQRHWIGVTPAEVEIRRGSQVGPLASLTHARQLVARREEPCYTGTFGLYHTGSGHTSPTDDTEGPACDSAVSSVPALRTTFTLNSAIMAAAEAQLGRMGAGQLKHYTTGNARLQLDPRVWELPGAMPEIAPSPDFKANITQKFTERSMALQAWGTYGVLWPVVHYQLGVAPDMGHNRVAVVPQVPTGQHKVAGQDIRIGTGSVDVTATSSSYGLRTVVRQTNRWRLAIGAVLPAGAHVTSVRLDGHKHAYRITQTSRGRQIVLNGGSKRGTSTLVIAFR